MLRRAYQRALEISSQRLKEHELTPRQGMAIVAIGAHGAMSQAELGQDIAMEPANVSGLVDRLKKKV
ncbi:MAG: MarR family transcriptional regulator [Alphaproteobacteria bacterium]|nr:MarR family transcriptional regulator [Alphaproteobacteria bacterium]